MPIFIFRKFWTVSVIPTEQNVRYLGRASTATNGDAAQAAIDLINAIANPQLPKVGERFLGTVVKTTAFGAFVSLLPGRDGLVHISKLGKGKRIAKVEDVVNVGDKLQVEIADIDKRGKTSLVPVDDSDDNE